MNFSVATWNINSVRLRTNLVSHLLTGWGPDILYLQEIKCGDADFPTRVWRNLLAQPDMITSIGMRDWDQTGQSS